MELVKKLSGFINQQSTGNVYCFTAVNGQIGEEDYIDVHGLTCYLQDLKKTEVTKRLSKPDFLGLPNNHNLQVVNLEISY